MLFARKPTVEEATALSSLCVAYLDERIRDAERDSLKYYSAR